MVVQSLSLPGIVAAFCILQGTVLYAFSTWKLYSNDDDCSTLDSLAKLLCLCKVALVDLVSPLSSNTFPLDGACLIVLTADFVMGNASSAPTPNSCGDRWWNIVTLECNYMIPPLELLALTNYWTLVEGTMRGAFAVMVLIWRANNVTGSDGGYQTLPWLKFWWWRKMEQRHKR